VYEPTVETVADWTANCAIRGTRPSHGRNRLVTVPSAAPGASSNTVPGVPRQRPSPSWAEPDPIDELAERLDEFVAAAVHPDEIAALLESDGMSDDQIRGRYGVKNSFALAEELYERVDRRFPEPTALSTTPGK